MNTSKTKVYRVYEYDENGKEKTIGICSTRELAEELKTSSSMSEKELTKIFSSLYKKMGKGFEQLFPNTEDMVKEYKRYFNNIDIEEVDFYN